MSWNKLQALWEREEAVPNCVRHAWNTRWHIHVETWKKHRVRAMTCSQSVSVNMSQFSQSIITCSLMSVLSGNSLLPKWKAPPPRRQLNFIGGDQARDRQHERCTQKESLSFSFYMVHNPACRSWIRVKGTKTQKAHFLASHGWQRKVCKSTRAQRAACAPARHWHCPTITQLTFFAPTTAKTVQSSSRERARRRDGDLLSPEGLAQRVNATNSELLNRPGKGVTLSSRVPVRSGLRRYVAQDHDPWCPFVRDGAASAAGAWDQIIPQQMDPNASWEVLFLWKDF